MCGFYCDGLLTRQLFLWCSWSIIVPQNYGAYCGILASRFVFYIQVAEFNENSHDKVFIDLVKRFEMCTFTVPMLIYGCENGFDSVWNGIEKLCEILWFINVYFSDSKPIFTIGGNAGERMELESDACTSERACDVYLT